MSMTDLVGFFASALVFSTFCMRSMLPLRLVATASNLAFITYALLGGLLPVLILHAILLPVNVFHLWLLSSASWGRIGPVRSASGAVGPVRRRSTRASARVI